MDLENPFYHEIVEKLNKTQVEFILIGGLAVGYYGYSRYTGDMDLWLNPSIENMDRLFLSLGELGYNLNLVLNIKEKRELENPTPIKLWDDSSTFKVDLMTNTFQTEFSWQESRKQCSMIKIGNSSCPVVHINHFIHEKKFS